MIDFTIETQGTDTFLVTQMPDNVRKDTVGIGMLHNNKIPGLSALSEIKMDNKEYLRYNISSHISLEQVFQGETDKKRFLTILKSILTTIKTLDDYMMEPGFLLLDNRNIYVNVGTMNTLLIYYPIMMNEKEFQVKAFVKEMLMNMEFNAKEDNSYVAELINFLNGANNVTVEEVLEEVNRISQETTRKRVIRPVANPISAQQGFAENTQPQMQTPVQMQMGMAAPVQSTMQPSMMQGVPMAAQASTEEKKEEKAQRKMLSLFGKKESKEKEEKKSFLSKPKTEKKSKKQVETPAGIVIPGMENVKNSTLPQPPRPAGAPALERPRQEMPQMPVQPQAPTQPQYIQQPVQPQYIQQPVQPQYVQQPVEPQYVSANQSYGETIVLNNHTGSEETVVLSAIKNGGMQLKKAYLLRKRTNEKIEISKEIFKIGKEMNYVDYCITNNSAISRSHADIICQGNQYYIVDNNSLNHTFVNDQQIPSQQPVKLEDFARIKLADEVFEFCCG